MRLMAVDTLEEAGYTVREAGTADEALAMLEGGADVDVLFTDIKMPGSMDGLGLASTVAMRWPGIRIIITSGHMILPDSADPTHAAFLPKPYRGNALTARIASLAA